MSTTWSDIPFADFLADTKDGEWGVGAPGVGLSECLIVRGTDFADIDSPAAMFPRRWIKDHIVAKKRLKAGDIILETAGGTSSQSTGRTALLKPSFFAHHNSNPVLCASFSRHLRIGDQHNSRFLYYLLQGLYRFGYMGVFNIQHTGVSRFQFTDFKNHTKLRVPDKNTQRKIAAVLAAYDDLIEANRRRIALLERMAEEIYREWFVRLRFPGHATTKITKGVPAGWTPVRTQDAFTFTGGGTPSKEISRYWQDGTVNWFTPTDITAAEGIFLEESRDKCTDEGFAASSAKMFPAFSVMMTSRATIGAVGINLSPACTNQGFITCVPNERYPLPFLYHWIKLGKTHFEMLSVGATFAELTKGTFKRINVLTPPQSLMNAFAETEAPFFKQIENLLRQNTHLTRTRDLLLPRLISGKLSVENLDITFPPSMADTVTASATKS